MHTGSRIRIVSKAAWLFERQLLACGNIKPGEKIFFLSCNSFVQKDTNLLLTVRTNYYLFKI